MRRTMDEKKEILREVITKLNIDKDKTEGVESLEILMSAMVSIMSSNDYSNFEVIYPGSKVEIKITPIGD